MENWQLIWVIFASVITGALIPVFITLSIGLYKSSKEIANISKQLTPTLKQIHTITDRVETFSRGFDGGGESISELLAATGMLARGLKRNMKFIVISSTVVAAISPAVAAFFGARHPAKEKNMERTCKYTIGHIFIAALGGSLVGAVTAFLVAPKSGRETRKQIDGYINDAKHTLSRVPEAIKSVTHSAKEAIIT